MTVTDTPETLLNCRYKTLKNAAIEPFLPSATSQSVRSSQSHSLTSPKPDSLLFGSDCVSIPGSDRRRSLRLASKMAHQDCGRSFISYSRRRKKTVSRESDGGLDSENEDMSAKKARVFDGIEENEGLGIMVVEGDGGFPEIRVSRESGGCLDSESENLRRMKGGAVDEIKGNEGLAIGVQENEGILVEEDRGFLENTVSRENGVNLVGSEGSNVRELGKIESSCGGVSSMERGESEVIDHAKGKCELDLDLNFPAPEAAEGNNERGFQDKTELRPIIDEKKIEIIFIDSDDGEDDGVQFVCRRNTSVDVELGRMYIDPFVDRSTSMSGRRRYTKEEKGKGKEVDNWLSISNGESKRNLDLDFNTIEIDPSGDGSNYPNNIRRYTEEEKGKGKVFDNWLSISTEPVVLNLEPEVDDNSFDNPVPVLLYLSEIAEQEEAIELKELELFGYRRERAILRAREKALVRREDARRNHEIAREHAPELAHLDSNELMSLIRPSEGKSKMPSVQDDKELEDLLGPFSTALKIIKERNWKPNGQQKTLSIEWMPSRDKERDILVPYIPSLLDLSVHVLAKNAEAIVSLEPVPDALKHKLSHAVCDSRKMNGKFVELLVRGSPSEVRVKDCSWMTEDDFTNIFGSCDTKNLRVLQLDLCGQCMLDYTLRNTLARSSNSCPALATISLRGACRLSDMGLNALTVSAPSLQSINLGQCPLLTSAGINNLANCVGPTLRELYIDECQDINALLIIPALKKFKHLEVLSVAGIQTVCDDFVSEIIPALGPDMKELVLANCVNLTDISLKVIGNNCSRLRALDLFNSHNLTDSALKYLANGCRSIQTLKLCRTGFSDEAIAAFLEVSGQSLKELSLNNVAKVGPSTALSLSKYSRNLLSLDLSWCRKLMDEALGLIVDSCLSLRLLKLFGCTQVTDVFLNGHSNSSVRIIGLKNMPVLKHLNVLEPSEAPLRYSPLIFSLKSQSSVHPGV